MPQNRVPHVRTNVHHFCTRLVLHVLRQQKCHHYWKLDPDCFFSQSCQRLDCKSDVRFLAMQKSTVTTASRLIQCVVPTKARNKRREAKLKACIFCQFNTFFSCITSPLARRWWVVAMPKLFGRTCPCLVWTLQVERELVLPEQATRSTR